MLILHFDVKQPVSLSAVWYLLLGWLVKISHSVLIICSLGMCIGVNNHHLQFIYGVFYKATMALSRVWMRHIQSTIGMLYWFLPRNIIMFFNYFVIWELQGDDLKWFVLLLGPWAWQFHMFSITTVCSCALWWRCDRNYVNSRILCGNVVKLEMYLHPIIHINVLCL